MPVIENIITLPTKPVIVDFQNANFESDEVNKLSSAIFKNKDKKTVVGVESKRITYTGVVKENDQYNHYLVISNKKTNKCRLIEIDYATLQPQTENKKDLLNVTSVHEQSYSELNMKFGSKRIIRQTEQHEKLKMNIDAVKEDLEKTVAAIEIDTTDLGNTTQSENDSDYRPNINRNASRKEDVYNLEEIVPRSILDSLTGESTQVLENIDSLEELKFQPFAAYCMQTVSNMNISQEEKLEKCKIIVYVHYLLHYFATPTKSMPKKFYVCENRDVNFHIIDNFSIVSNSGRLRPLAMKIKGLCCILVLSLLALDFEINIEELSKDMKMGIKKIQEIARVLALSTGANKNCIVLKLPLPPAVSVIAKRKRK